MLVFENQIKKQKRATKPDREARGQAHISDTP